MHGITRQTLTPAPSLCTAAFTAKANEPESSGIDATVGYFTWSTKGEAMPPGQQWPAIAGLGGDADAGVVGVDGPSAFPGLPRPAACNVMPDGAAEIGGATGSQAVLSHISTLLVPCPADMKHAVGAEWEGIDYSKTNAEKHQIRGAQKVRRHAAA